MNKALKIIPIVLALVLPILIMPLATTNAATVSISTSADSHSRYFYNGTWIEVKVVDPNMRGAGNVTIYLYKNGVLVNTTTLKEIGSSGVFVGYIIYEALPGPATITIPAHPLTNDFIYLGNASYVNFTTSTGATVASFVTPVVGSLSSGDTLKIEYIGPTATVSDTLTYSPFTAQITLDRSSVPAFGNATIHVTIYDQDYNKDPTAKDTIPSYTLRVYAVDKLGNVYKTGTITVGPLTETDVNSAKFTTTLTLKQVLNALGFSNYLINNTDYLSSIVLSAVNITALANGNIPFDHVIVESEDNTNATFTLLQTNGIIESPTSTSVVSLATELQITVKDADRNLDTAAKDWVLVNVSTPFGYVLANLTETGDNTGVFQGTVKLTYNTTNWTPNGVGDEIGLSKPCTLTIAYLDPSTLTNITTSKISVNVKSYTPELTVTPTEVLPTGTVTITLKDMDLNDKGNATSDSFGATLAAGSPIHITMYRGEGIFIVEVNGTVANASTNAFVFFDEVQPGVFNATFDLSWIQGNLGAGTKIKFIWKDLFSNATAEAEISVIKPKINVTLDRSVYPLPNSGSFKLYVTVNDPYANFNPGLVDTISASHCNVTITLWNGTEIFAGSIPLTETDINTGIFTGSLTVNLTKLAGGVSNIYVFTGSKITVTFQDPATGNIYTANAVIKPSTATLSVNATTVKTGDYITITLVEPDANTDSHAINHVTVSVSGDVTGTITLDETGDNTGVFTKTLRIGVDYPFNTTMAHKTFKISYTDNFTAETSVTMAREKTCEVSVFVKSFTAQVWVGTPTTENNTVGPYSTITIYYKDPDDIITWEKGNNLTFSSGNELFLYDELGDSLRISSMAPVSGYPGLFEAQVKLNFSSTANTSDNILQVKVPDTIIIRAVDPCDASGVAKAIIYTVHVRAWNGTIKIEPSKPYYNNGEDIKIIVVDPDQNKNPNVAETINVRITSWKMVNGQLQPVDPAGRVLTLVETGPNTGVFEAPFTIDTQHPPPFFTVGDILKVTYNDPIGASGKPVTVSVLLPIGYTTPTPIKPGPPANVTFTDLTGKKITPKAGVPMLVRIPVTNLDTTRSVTVDIILVAYTPEGVPVSISYGRVTLSPGQSTVVSVGWIPPAAGNYTVKVFFWNLAEMKPLSETPLKLTVTVE